MNPRTNDKHQDSGLRRLSFNDNFEGQEVQVTLPATGEVQVRNPFKNGQVPSRYIILSQTGNGLITKGPTSWTKDFIYLYNNGASSVTITVFFLR